MSGTKFGNFNDLLDITEEELRIIASELREVILSIRPMACEVVRLGDRAATYGVGPKKMKEGCVYILPYESWVNLGFYQGSSLNDANRLLEGTGKNMRHIKIHTIEQVNNTNIEELIKLAFTERENAIEK